MFFVGKKITLIWILVTTASRLWKEKNAAKAENWLVNENENGDKGKSDDNDQDSDDDDYDNRHPLLDIRVHISRTFRS